MYRAIVFKTHLQVTFQPHNMKHPRCILISQVFLFLLLLTLSITSFAQPGALDPSFAGNGKLRTLLGTSCQAYDVKVQPNGRIVAAGYYTTSQNKTNFLVERYTAAGVLDNTFAGGDGEQGISFGDFSEADALALQPDGKIIATGSGRPINYAFNFIAVRLNSDGSADKTFGTNGKVILQNTSGYDKVHVCLLPNGKIILAGSTYNSNLASSSLTVVRLNANGSIDYTFGTNGFQVVTIAAAAYTLGVKTVLQPDGKLVLSCGLSTLVNGYNQTQAALVRINPNGGLDNTFGTGGIVIQNINKQNTTAANDLLLQPDGKIVAAGSYLASSGLTNFLVMRFNTNGTMDNTFAGNGRAGISFNYNCGATSIVLQPSGDLIVGGSYNTGLNISFAIARLLPNGTPDDTFGSAQSGKVTTDLGSSDDINAMTLQPDGKLLAAGGSGNDMGFARYLVSGSGARSIDPEPVTAIALQPSLYPNPGKGLVNIVGLDAQSATPYTLTDAAGIIRAKGNLSPGNPTQLNIAQLPAGVYFIQLQSKTTVHTLRFLKE